MSALPGYINRGCVNTLFLSIRKHLNVRTSALIIEIERHRETEKDRENNKPLVI